MNTTSWWMLAAFATVSFAAAGINGYFTSLSIQTWYPTLVKPAWNPPNWLFGPVWTLLFFCIAIAGWLVWRSKGFQAAALPLTIFGVQLLLNAGWSWCFFGLQNPGLAFVEILFLWASILATILTFWPISPVAGALLIPYQLWVSFAAFLNFTIWKLNP
ncbi:MAG: tryptophan-rich sensory protein [Deltaproteobacteria bacterium]|nr:MAG: tryptophan-rich sensory protein [Deltaproteobacteria bacterium]